MTMLAPVVALTNTGGVVSAGCACAPSRAKASTLRRTSALAATRAVSDPIFITSAPRRSVTTSATWGIDASFRYLGLAKTPMASGWLPDTVTQPRFLGEDV